MNKFLFLKLLMGLSLFLYGINLMSVSLEKSSNINIRKLIKKCTSNPFAAVLTGMGVTAVIQSSSAVTSMVVSLVNSGVMEFYQSIGIIFGTNIGTTITAWILCIDINSIIPLLAIIGVLILMFTKRKNCGNSIISFAILFFGMQLMSEATQPLANTQCFLNVLTALKNPFFSLLAGAVITAIIQSSSASVGMLQVLSSTGNITYGVAIPIIMGQNIGTCITALISCIGTNRNAKRVAFLHLYFNILSSGIFLIVLYILKLLNADILMNCISAKDIAVIHSLFNIAAVVILFPWQKRLAELVQKTIG